MIRQRDLRKDVSFVLAYHPLFKAIGKIINKDLYLLDMNNKVKKVFTPKPIISFRSARKMSSYLVIQKKKLKIPLSVVVSIIGFV